MAIKFKRNGILVADAFYGPGGDDMQLWHKLDQYDITSSTSNVDIEYERNGSWEKYKTIKIIYQNVQISATANLTWKHSDNSTPTFASSYRNQVVRTNSTNTTMVDNASATRSTIEATAGCDNASTDFAHGYIIEYNWQDTSSDHYYDSGVWYAQNTTSNAGGCYSFSGFNPNGRTTYMRFDPGSATVDNGTFTVWGCKYG